MTRSRWIVALALAAFTPAAADRLHLQGGGVIDAERWWYEGDAVLVESAEGSIGIPRSLVVRIETGTPKPLPPQPAPAAKHATAAGRSDAGAAMKAANEALVARDFEKAALRFHEVIRLEPKAPGPRVGYALATMALGRDYAALPVVLDGLVQDPAAAQLHEILGDLRDRDERVDDAIASWKESFRLEPCDRVRDKIIKGEREQTAGRDYAFSAAAHFNMRYEGALDQDLVGALTDYLEDRFRAFGSTYRYAPSQPITVLLYPQQAFHDVTQVGNEVAGLFDGKIRVPLGGLKRIDPQAQRVLAHELTHAFVQSKTRGNCPRWLHEGLAQISEERTLRRSERAQLVRSVNASDPGSWPDRSFSYPKALAFTQFLQERRGFDVLVSVLERLGDGESLDTALGAFYGGTYAELAKTWAEGLGAEGAR